MSSFGLEACRSHGCGKRGRAAPRACTRIIGPGPATYSRNLQDTYLNVSCAEVRGGAMAWIETDGSNYTLRSSSV